MIRITQMVLIFGTIWLIYITGITSTDEKLSQTSQCIQPIEYNISLEIQNTNLVVNSSVVLNVSCVQYRIRLQIGRYCNLTDTINVKPEDITNIYYHFFVKWTSTRLQSSNSSKQVDSVDIMLVEDEQFYRRIKEEREKPIEIGLYTISSTYICSLEKVATVFSIYRNQSKTKEVLMVPNIPSEWIFPYWENPAIRAKFNIQIKHKNSEIALSNIPIEYIKVQTNQSHTKFSTTSPISTHLIAVFVIPKVYDISTLINNTLTIRSNLSMISDTLYAQTLISDITRRIRSMLDDIIPRSYVNYVLLPINSTYYKSIVTTKLVLLSEANIIYNKETDSIVKEREIICRIARSVIQEMFSDWLVTFRQLYSWFIEGFSTVYGVYIGKESLMESIVVQTRRNSLDYTEAFKYDFPIQENRFITRNLTLRKLWQEKAFSLFYMLNTFLDETLLHTMFKEAVSDYYKKYFEASIHNRPENIKRIITSWISQVGYPVVEVKRKIKHTDNTQKSYTVMSVVDCFNVDHNEPCEQTWWIPMIIKRIQNTEVIANIHIILNPNLKVDFTPFSEENEFDIAVNSFGYRVNYDRESWKFIIRYLNNVNSTTANISDVIKAQLLDDAFYFLVQNTQYNEETAENIIDLDIYLELASSIFHVNNSYTAWYPVFIALETMSKMFPFPESVLSKHIKDTLLQMLHKFLDDMSYTHSSKNSVNNQFYHEVLKWTCIFGSFNCKDHINAILEWHFTHPTQNKLLPSWQKWIYCQGLMLETLSYVKSALWQTIFNIYQTQEKKQELFEFVPCSRQYKDLYGYLSFLERNSLPNPKDSLTAENNDTKTILNTTKSVTVTLLFNIFTLHSKNNTALDIILFGLINGIGRDLNMPALINCIINNIYLDDGLAMISHKMFLKKLSDIHHMGPFVVDAIKKKIEYRRRFLVEMNNRLLYKPQYVFNYKQITK